MNRDPKQLKPDVPYDEIAGEIREGDLLRVQEFKPPFVIVRVTKVQRPVKGMDGKPTMEIVAEPWQLPYEPGKMHSGLVRVVDPEKERRAEELLNQALEPDKPKGRPRSVTKIDEHGNAVEAT